MAGAGAGLAADGRPAFARTAAAGALGEARGRSSVAAWLLGLVGGPARTAAVARINRDGGTVVELGVGNGASLSRYGSHVGVIGIDTRPAPLRIAAARRARRGGWTAPSLLVRADYDALPLADAMADRAVAVLRLGALADPAPALAELVRVVRPGGEIVIADFFAHGTGWRASVQRFVARIGKLFGGGREATIDPILATDGLTLTTMRRLPPLGLFTILCLRASGPPPRATAALGPREARPQGRTRKPGRRRLSKTRTKASPHRRRRLTG